MLSRLKSSSGGAVVMVLMVALIAGAVGVAIWQRSQSTSERTNQQANLDKARAAADAGLEMAVQRIIQVGSTTFNETDCSLLDFPPKVDSVSQQPSCDNGAATPSQSRNPSVGGFTRSASDSDTYATGESTFTYTIRGSGSTRTITATGIYSADGNPNSAKAVKSTKTQRIAVTPRALRYGLFSSGDRAATGSPSVLVRDNGALFLPPTNKTGKPKTNRGSDLGGNRPIKVSGTGSINKQESNPTLYGELFGQVGWGQATTASSPSSSTSPSTAGSFRVDGAVRQRSNTSLPSIDVESISSSATSPGSFAYLRAQARAVTDRQQYFNVRSAADRAALQSFLSADREVTGVVMIENLRGDCPLGALGVQLANALVIKNGSLVVYGCNLTAEGSNYALFVDHPMASNTGTDAAANKLPALIVSRNAEDQGGSMTVNYGGGLATIGSLEAGQGTGPSSTANTEGAGDSITLEGASIITGDLTVGADAPLPANSRGNLYSNGALIVGGTTNIGGGASPAVLTARWNPIAQELALDPSSIGTYTVKSYDRPSSATSTPNDGVSVNINPKPPASPADYGGVGQKYTFQWSLADNYEEVTCTLKNTDTGAEQTWDCPFRAKTVTGLQLDTNYTFTVKACTIQYGQSDKTNPSGGGFNNKQKTCGSDSADFYVPPQSLGIAINSSSKPANPTQSSNANFSWSVTGGSARRANTFQCQINGGGWQNCTNAPTANSLTNLSSASDGTTYTFEVKVTNGYSTATDSYTWKVLPASAPVLTFTNYPAGVVEYTSRTAGFAWREANGVSVGSYQCSLDSPSNWQSCSTPYTTPTLSNGGSVDGDFHTLYVRGYNIIGWGNPISYQWRIKPDPVSAPWFASGPGTISSGATGSGASLGYNGAVATLQCSDNNSNWWNCGSSGNYTGGSGSATFGVSTSPCADLGAYIRATNATSTSASVGRGYHRNCRPVAMTLRWNWSRDNNGGWGNWFALNNKWRGLDAWIQSEANRTNCQYEKSYNGGFNIAADIGSNDCSGFPAGSYVENERTIIHFRAKQYLVAVDGSSQGWFYSWANYNSNGFGYQCTFYSLGTSSPPC